MNTLSDIAKFEKNKQFADSVYVILMQMNLTDGKTVIHLAYNTENVQWRGETWQSFPLSLGDSVQETDGSIPNLEIKVSNVTKALMGYFEKFGGFNGTIINLYIVNTENLSSKIPEIEEKYKVLKGNADENWIKLTVGPAYSPDRKMPQRRYLKNACQRCYKSAICGYNGAMTTCDHTLADCRRHGNKANFGGYPGIDQGGVYK